MQPITLLICALGGEGGGVLAQWLIDTARASGYAAQSTSIPGVAQRTGATTYYVEVFPTPLAELGGKRPVFSLYPAPGQLDALVSSELLETARQIAHGMSSAGRTRVITASNRSYTTMERMQMGDGRTDSAPLLALVRAHSREHHVLDMSELARSNGTIVSAVMLGAIAGSGLFPFPRTAYESVVGLDGKTAQASLRGFVSALDVLQRQLAQATQVQELLAAQDAMPTGAQEISVRPELVEGLDFDKLSPNGVALGANGVSFIPDGTLNDESFNPSASAPLPAALAQQFPPQVHELLALGHARLLDYQDASYAALYVTRLQQVLQAESASDTSGTRGYAITVEMCRWLALWMAFDDVVRVADLKSRASRWARVRAEVKVGAHDLLKVYDHFKPGLPELAGLLPSALASKLIAWERRRSAAGQAPLALPLKIGTHSVLGMAALRLLAACKRLRPLGSRYATEQALIEQWLASVVSSTQADWQCGLELAQCGRLIKGYGSTNERGKDNLLHITQHLAQAPHLASAPERAAALAAARIAALTDEAGTALDVALVQHGAPAREVKPQPIRWVKNPKIGATR